MKKLLIASVAVAAIGLGGLALAQPAGPGMRHHEPVKEIVEHLRGISLSDAQREEIKTLLSAFKDANPQPLFGDIEKPSFDFATATEAQINTFIQTQIEEREARHFAFAQLRHDIYKVLDEEQQATLLARDAKRDTFKETSKTNREMLGNFRNAQRDLVRSQSFSKDAWDALIAQYKDGLVNAGVEKAKQHLAMFQVLTSEQQARIKALREEERKLHELFKL